MFPSQIPERGIVGLNAQKNKTNDKSKSFYWKENILSLLIVFHRKDIASIQQPSADNYYHCYIWDVVSYGDQVLRSEESVIHLCLKPKVLTAKN